MNIKLIRNEPNRACGSRKPGGFYLVANGLSMPCGKLPIPMAKVCGECGNLHYYHIEPGKTAKDGRIKFSRSPRLLENPSFLWDGIECLNEDICTNACPLSDHRTFPLTNSLLVWIGKQHYATPQEFVSEAHKQGVSRRIPKLNNKLLPRLPKKFTVGINWVFVAHLEVVELDEETEDGITHLPAIFHAFRPDRIEYIIEGTETQQELDAMVEQGITLVKLIDKETQCSCDSLEGVYEHLDLYEVGSHHQDDCELYIHNNEDVDCPSCGEDIDGEPYCPSCQWSLEEYDEQFELDNSCSCEVMKISLLSVRGPHHKTDCPKHEKNEEIENKIRLLKYEMENDLLYIQEEMTKDELEASLKAFEKSPYGNKEELVERLVKARVQLFLTDKDIIYESQI